MSADNPFGKPHNPESRPPFPRAVREYFTRLIDNNAGWENAARYWFRKLEGSSDPYAWGERWHHLQEYMAAHHGLTPDEFGKLAFEDIAVILRKDFEKQSGSVLPPAHPAGEESAAAIEWSARTFRASGRPEEGSPTPAAAPPVGQVREQAPAWDEDYRPLKDFVDGQRFPSFKAATKFLKEHPEIPRHRPLSKKGEPIRNRLVVHFGAWHACLKQSDRPGDPDPEDINAAEADALIETQRRIDAARRQKHAERDHGDGD